MEFKKRVLIAGGSGFIGTQLKNLLVKNGYAVGIISRKQKNIQNADVITWDIKSQTIHGDISSYNTIVNLNGASISGKRWTPEYKRELHRSRIDSVDLISKTLLGSKNALTSYIGASAIGYYGDHENEWINEDAPPNEGFLGKLSKDWEEAHLLPDLTEIRKVILRIGLVLSPHAGALKPMLKSSAFGMYPVFGSGGQYQSWIHIQDMCRMIMYCIENRSLEGIYNAVAPNPVTNKTFMQILKEVKGSPGILIPVPRFALQLGAGEIADLLFLGQRISAQKITEAGFTFKFPELEKALKDLLAIEN